MTNKENPNRELTYEEGRQSIWHLIDAMKKTTVHLPVAAWCASLAHVLKLNSSTQTLTFVRSFVKEWEGWLDKVELPSGEIGYRWA